MTARVIVPAHLSHSVEDQDELNHWLLALGHQPVTVKAIHFELDAGPDALTLLEVYKTDEGGYVLDEATGLQVVDEVEGPAMSSLPMWCIAPDEEPDDEDA